MNNNRNFLVYGAATASFGYIFSIATGSIGMLLFIASWLLNFRDLNFKNLLKWNNLFILTLFFLIFLLGIFYSINIVQGQKDIIRHLPFLIFPLIFITIKPFLKKERLLIVKIFIHSLSIFFCICLITAIIRQIGFWHRGGIFNWYYFYRYDFLEIFNQHPTYLSMFTLLSIGFLLFSKSQLLLSKVLFYLTILIQTLALILYGSRIGYILLFLIILIHFFKNLLSKEETNRIRYVLIYSIGLSILFLISFNIPIVKERFLYTIGYKYDYKFNNKEFIKHNSPEELGRLLLWQDAADLIKENPFLGYGTGATRDVLLQKYKKEDHTLFLEKRFNAHNSYLELLLSGGIILLISYLAILLVLFLKSVRKKDYVLFSFALIITITSITESLFIAQGILFISFFYCFFLIKINE
ncbi:hypothetical protein KCTC32420_00966 [Aequorivita nionensis]